MVTADNSTYKSSRTINSVNNDSFAKEVCSGTSSLWKIQMPGPFQDLWNQNFQKCYAGIHIFKLQKWLWNILEVRANVLLGKLHHHKSISLNLTDIKIRLLLGQDPCSPSLVLPKQKVNLCLSTSAPDFSQSGMLCLLLTACLNPPHFQNWVQALPSFF